MDTHPDVSGKVKITRPGDVQLLAPTVLEYAAIRVVMPSSQPLRCGIGLARRYPIAERPTVICGLAGSLTDALRPGDVVVPNEVATEHGEIVSCDSELVELLRQGAQRAGYTPRSGRLLTATSIVTGSAREQWATRGFDVADMETGHLACAGGRIATVRVILDSPSSPIAGDWLDAGHALTRPRFWKETAWLVRTGPTYAWRAARVLHSALDVPSQ